MGQSNINGGLWWIIYQAGEDLLTALGQCTMSLLGGLGTEDDSR